MRRSFEKKIKQIYRMKYLFGAGHLQIGPIGEHLLGTLLPMLRSNSP